MEPQSGDDTLRQRLWACQQRREFCDVILQTETGDGVWAHKVILSAGSKLLHKMLTSPRPPVGRGGGRGDGVQVVTLLGVTRQELGDLVRLLYLQEDMQEEVSVDIMALSRYYQFYEPLLSRCGTHPAQDAVSTVSHHGQLHTEKNLTSRDSRSTYITPGGAPVRALPGERTATSPSPTAQAAREAAGGTSPTVWLSEASPDQRIVVLDEAHHMAVGAVLSSGHVNQGKSIGEEEQPRQTCEDIIKQIGVKQNDKTGGIIFVDLTADDEDMSSGHPGVVQSTGIQTEETDIDDTTEDHISQKDGSSPGSINQSDEEYRSWSPVLLEGVGLDSFGDSEDDVYVKEQRLKEVTMPEPRKPLLQVSDSRIIVSSDKENMRPKPVKETSPPSSSRHACPTKTVRRGRMKYKSSHKTVKNASTGIWMGGY